jgi:hypothetical protein
MRVFGLFCMGIVNVGFLVLSSGCIVAAAPDRQEVRDERWCANHPRKCDHVRWCSDHPGQCDR